MVRYGRRRCLPHFGKSVIRKTGSDGKLIDSNNSTNDFESNTKASLIK